jgi:hypothetical protein
MDLFKQQFLHVSSYFLTLLFSSDEVIPDPIKLVHRVVALELAMKIIEKDCQELAEKRKRVVMDVMKRQNKCVDSLNKAS